MALSNAHEGYEYQDLLTCYFILQEILNENVSEFFIDRKEFADDKIDDLTIIRQDKKIKKQIKYSNADSNHRLCKNDLSSETAYQLSIDTLFKAWQNNPQKENTEFRICLSWLPPQDTLLEILNEKSGIGTFSNHKTTVYQIDGARIWPENAEPLSSWRRFKAESQNINRDNFLQFCKAMIIEVEMPKLSLNLDQPGELEVLVLNQARNLGVGIFPNEHWRVETFVLTLLAIIKRSRSRGQNISSSNLFHELNLVTDYGSIAQNFPIVEHENVLRKTKLNEFVKDTQGKSKVILVGEPGSGKSWFVENLTKILRKQEAKVVRHYCYTKLDDSYQQERIKVNVFYGNLIAELIETFPRLKELKEQKFASNLNELNRLLLHIDEPTYVFIDGLDHIERVASYRNYSNISKQDIAIIENIAKLKASPNVKIIVTSQYIDQLRLINEFEIVSLPDWKETDIKRLLKNRDINNLLLAKDLKLSQFLLEKSTGNPLYLKYLLDDIEKRKNPTLAELRQLPDYSFNLSQYYQYLLSQLNTREEVPQVLSGVSFSLTKTELQEITLAGDYVDESLKILSPVLTLNLAKSGYRIYHESFRRFILEHLRSRNIPVEKKIFKPIQEWFQSKDFFIYRKSYRYFLQFLFEGDNYPEILALLNHTFVTDSLINGYSWELIERNYKYFVDSACRSRDFKNIILLNEINKVIHSCAEDFDEMFSLYAQTLGEIYGYGTVSEYLIFDGMPTMSLYKGLQACYICDQNGSAAPWSVYMDFFKPGKPVKQEQFKYFLRGMLVLDERKRIAKIAKRLLKIGEGELSETFRKEFKQFKNQSQIKDLQSEFPAIAKIMDYQAAPPAAVDRDEIIRLAREITSFDNVFHKEEDIIIKFIQACRLQSNDDELHEILVKLFKGKNWFYNWLIYTLKIMRVNKDSAYADVKSAFDYLAYDTEPFRGKPRTCDLYSIHAIILNSIHQGLNFLKSSEQWKETIDTLVEVSNSVATSIQRTNTGPLTTDKLFGMLSEYACPENIAYINQVFESITEQKEEYHLHGDIAEYNLRLASIVALSKDKDRALGYFQKAIQFALAYTMRKDMTLVDVIEGIKAYAKVSPVDINETLRLSRMMVDSAVDHTDGKETAYFPELWFKSFLEIDLSQSMVYLLHQLVALRYDWRAEGSLVDLLVKLDGSVNPELEAWLALSFPVRDGSDFIQYCLNLYHKLLPYNPALAEKLAVRIIPAMRPRNNRHRSDALVSEYNQTLGKCFGQVKYKNERNYSTGQQQHWYDHLVDRTDFSDMSETELLAYFESDKLQSGDLNSLGYVLDGFPELTGSLKELVSTIVSKNNNRYSGKLSLDDVFATGNDIECYYWVCRFVNDRGGWFQKLVNQDAFVKAHALNPEMAFTHLFELLPAYLEIGFSSEFSANLIKLLVDLGYDNNTIEMMWQNLMTMTSYRLPSQDQIDWQQEAGNPLEMNDEEILLSILICRYRANTIERYRWTTAALEMLLEKHSEKLIKPFQWFLENRGLFEKSAESIILQFIAAEKEKGHNFHKHFEEPLKKGFPSRYFHTDLIIAKLYGLKVSQISLKPGFSYPSISEGHYNFLFNMNRRFRIYEDFGVDLEQAFSKFSETYATSYEDILEAYANRPHKRMVPHIYFAEHLQKILNEDHYDELRDWSEMDSEEGLTFGLMLAIDAMATHANAFGLRPSDLKRPHEMDVTPTSSLIEEQPDWIRIAHQENELHEGAVFKLKSYKSYGAVVFSSAPKTNRPPYSRYSPFPFQIWWGRNIDFKIDENIIFSILQDDPIENFKILWLNPSLVTQLGLRTVRTQQGLVAKTHEGEIVLKMRTWSCDYTGDGYHNNLRDEIPKLTGTDLILRKDYFQKIKTYFPVEPIYVSKSEEGDFF